MIRIGFGTNKKPHSALIRWATGSPWSHVWIEYQSQLWGGWWVAHAAPTGVVKVPLEHVLRQYPKHTRLECRISVDDGFAWARSYVGAPYDYGAIWNGLLFAINRFTGWEWLGRLAMRNTSKFTCSELVTGFLKSGGLRSVVELDPELTPPSVLFEAVHQSVEFTRLS